MGKRLSNNALTLFSATKKVSSNSGSIHFPNDCWPIVNWLILNAFVAFQEGDSEESNNCRVAFSRTTCPVSLKSTARYVCIMNKYPMSNKE